MLRSGYRSGPTVSIPVSTENTLEEDHKPHTMSSHRHSLWEDLIPRLWVSYLLKDPAHDNSS